VRFHIGCPYSPIPDLQFGTRARVDLKTLCVDRRRLSSMLGEQSSPSRSTGESTAMQTSRASWSNAWPRHPSRNARWRWRGTGRPSRGTKLIALRSRVRRPKCPLTWWGGWGSNPRPRDYEAIYQGKRDHSRHKSPGRTTLDTVNVSSVPGFRPTASHGSGGVVTDSAPHRQHTSVGRTVLKLLLRVGLTSVSGGVLDNPTGS
jgi:hypothetical protein